MSAPDHPAPPISSRVRDWISKELAIWRALSPVMRGVLLMSLSTVGFAVMHVTIRHVSHELHSLQIAFLRNVLGLLFLLPFIAQAGFGSLRTTNLPVHALRGLINIGAMLLFFHALTITQLAKVTALSFTAPIFAGALSVLVLGERFRVRRWAATVIGFVGVLIVLRPGLAVIEPGAMMALAAAALWAGAMIMIKILSRTESSVTIVAYMGIFLGAFSLLPALWVWRDPSWEAWGWLLFIGLTGSIAQVSLSQSLKEAEPTAVLPFDFLKLIWVALMAAWFFGEIPDAYTWLGAGVIFAAGLYLAHRERVAARARVAETSP